MFIDLTRKTKRCVNPTRSDSHPPRFEYVDTIKKGVTVTDLGDIRAAHFDAVGLRRVSR